MRKLVLVALALALTACASSRSSNVGARMILPPMAPTTKVDERQLFFMASHLNPDKLPDYPAERMADGPEAARVCIDLVVDEGGEVISAVPLHGGPECPAGADKNLEAFEQAALASVRDWQFLAAAICTFSPG